MSTRPNPLNVLILYTDQLRYDCLGCHGHPIVKTPNIDRLARRGVDFQRTYAQAAICMPSRISLFTGQYPHTHGIQDNTSPVNTGHLVTLPSILRGSGYRSALIGKSHVGSSPDMGFEYVRLDGGSDGEKNDYQEYLLANGIEPDYKRDDSCREYDAYVSKIPYAHSREKWTGDRCMEFLRERDRNKPFFMWASFQRPHAPTCVPFDNPFPYDPDMVELPPYDEKFYAGPDSRRLGCENVWNVFSTGEKALRKAMANYFSLVTMVDEQVGRIIETLENAGDLGNTLIIFTSDHGDFCGEYGQFGKNTGTHEVLYRIPLIFYLEGATDREQIHELTESVDIMPTVLDMLGMECPRTVQGESLAPAVIGSSRRAGMPWEGKDAVFFETPFIKTVRTRTHKMSFCFRGDKEWGLLYDMVNDPGERQNLYGNPKYGWIQHELEKELIRWFIKTQQPQANLLSAKIPPWRWYRDYDTRENRTGPQANA